MRRQEGQDVDSDFCAREVMGGVAPTIWQWPQQGRNEEAHIWGKDSQANDLAAWAECVRDITGASL